MNREAALTLIREQLGRFGLSPDEPVRFVPLDSVDYAGTGDDALAIHAEPDEFDSDEAWEPYLNSGAGWVNASLIRLTDGSAVVSLIAGPDIAAADDRVGFTFSADRRQGVIVLDREAHPL